MPCSRIRSEGKVAGTKPVGQRFVLVVLFFALLPFSLTGGSLSIGFADALTPVVALYALRIVRKDNWWALYVVLVLASVAAICVAGISANQPAVSPLLSLIYYAKPWLYFFAAKHLVIRAADPGDALCRIARRAAWALAATVGFIGAGYLYAGALTTAEIGVLDGRSVLGFTSGVWPLPVRLYGHGQVNTTAALLVIATPLFLFQLRRAEGLGRVFWGALLPASWVEILYSGSRGAVLTLAIYLFVYTAFGRSKSAAEGLARVVVTGTCLVAAVVWSADLIAASPKYQMTLSALSGGAPLDVSSGRTTLAGIMLHDIYRSPLIGTSFGDFERFHSGDIGFTWLYSSPHDTYIGALHKGGIIIGVGFLLLMFHALRFRFRGLPREAHPFGPPLAFALAGGLMPVLDAFTSPQLAAAALIVLGGTTGLFCRIRAHEATDPVVCTPV